MRMRLTKTRMVLSVLALALVVICYLIRSVWAEDNPGLVLWSMVRLELTAARTVPLTPDSRKIITKTGNDDAVIALLAGHGWHYVERAGAFILFDRGGVRLSGSTRAVTQRYTIFEFDVTP